MSGQTFDGLPMLRRAAEKLFILFIHMFIGILVMTILKGQVNIAQKCLIFLLGLGVAYYYKDLS